MYSFDRTQFWPATEPSELATRKDEWRHIVKNLRIMTNIVSAKAHKYHKELYFKGSLHPDLLIKSGSKYAELLHLRIFEVPLLFHMWYHPKPSIEIYEEMILSQTRYNPIRDLIHQVFRQLYPRNFNFDYGLMGGREELLCKALYPSVDWKERRTIGGVEVSKSISLSLLSSCPAHTVRVLDSEMIISPYAVGQYFWNHIDYSLENYMEDCHKAMNVNKRVVVILRCFRSVLDFYDREGGHLSRPSAVKLQKELKDKFEAKEFGSFLTRLWQEEKVRYECGDPTPTEVEFKT